MANLLVQVDETTEYSFHDSRGKWEVTEVTEIAWAITSLSSHNGKFTSSSLSQLDGDEFDFVHELLSLRYKGGGNKKRDKRLFSSENSSKSRKSNSIHRDTLSFPKRNLKENGGVVSTKASRALVNFEKNGKRFSSHYSRKRRPLKRVCVYESPGASPTTSTEAEEQIKDQQNSEDDLPVEGERELSQDQENEEEFTEPSRMLLVEEDEEMHISEGKRECLSPRDEKNPYSIRILQNPADTSVYHRNLKPYPNLMIIADCLIEDNIFLVPTLLRCDSFKEEPYLTGNQPVKISSSGQQVTFRNLKVTTTSLQHQNTLFCVNFELRKYTNAKLQEYIVLDSIHTNPICILSHSNQLKPGSSSPYGSPSLSVGNLPNELNAPKSLQGKLGLRIIQQSPTRTVYRRILKPFPSLGLVVGSSDSAHFDNLFVEATLLRSDCSKELPLDLEGNRMVRISKNECATFKKLKIISTSQQMGTLVRLRFSLKRFSNNVFESVDDVSVLSDPIEVFSHILYLNEKEVPQKDSK